MVRMKKTSLFFKSTAFITSIVLVVIYLIFYIETSKLLFNKESLEFFFYMFLEFLPLIIAIFAILISFTDKEFLNFLKKTKTKIKISIYDGIIYYFIINSLFIFIALMLTTLVKLFNILNNLYTQLIMIFVFTYAIISLVQLVRFIFYFAKTKADYSVNFSKIK